MRAGLLLWMLLAVAASASSATQEWAWDLGNDDWRVVQVPVALSHWRANESWYELAVDVSFLGSTRDDLGAVEISVRQDERPLFVPLVVSSDVDYRVRIWATEPEQLDLVVLTLREDDSPRTVVVRLGHGGPASDAPFLLAFGDGGSLAYIGDGISRGFTAGPGRHATWSRAFEADGGPGLLGGVVLKISDAQLVTWDARADLADGSHSRAGARPSAVFDVYGAIATGMYAESGGFSAGIFEFGTRGGSERGMAASIPWDPRSIGWDVEPALITPANAGLGLGCVHVDLGISADISDCTRIIDLRRE